MNKKILTTILCFAMVAGFAGCGREEAFEAEAVAVEEKRQNFTQEDVEEAFYTAMEEDRNGRYDNADYVSGAILISGTDKYVEVKIPKEYVSEGISSISNGKRISAPFESSGCNVEIDVSAAVYDYASGRTQKQIIERTYDMVQDSLGYDVVSSPSGNDYSYKFIYDKDSTAGGRKASRCAIKSFADSGYVITITVATEENGGNLDVILDTDKAYEIMDSIEVVCDLSEEEAKRINEKVVNAGNNADFIAFQNPWIEYTVLNKMNLVNGSITKEKAQDITELSLELRNTTDPQGAELAVETQCNLTDLQYFTNLTELEINIYLLTAEPIPEIDLSSLANLKKLERLKIYLQTSAGGEAYHERFISLEPLKELTNIKDLEIVCLNHCMNNVLIKDISPIANMTRLEKLALHSQKFEEDGNVYPTITDISFLRDLIFLREIGVLCAVNEDEVSQLESELKNTVGPLRYCEIVNYDPFLDSRITHEFEKKAVDRNAEGELMQ